MNGFREVIRGMSNQSPVMVEIPAKPDLERVPMRREGSPDIVARPRLGQKPPFVEERNRAIGLHVAKEMDAPCRDWQVGRQSAPQGSGEPGSMLGALALRWGRAIQPGRPVAVHVPLDEAGTLATDLTKAPKV